MRSRLAMLAVSPRLRDLDRGHQNNLDLLRFLAASLVVYSHSYALSGHLHDEPLFRALRAFDFGGLAVAMFFAMSGFLVARSFDRSPSPGAFLRARALRIVPAYTMAVVYAALILGPLLTALPLREYVGDRGTWRYVASAMSFASTIDRLPGLFADNPYPAAVNGSLWTIALELFCYAALAVGGVLGALRRPRVALVLAVVLFAAFTLVPALVRVLPRWEAYSAPRLAGTFMVGALAYVWRDRVRLSPAAALAWITAIPWLVETDRGAYLAFGAVAYATLTLAFHPAFDLPAFRRFGDTSYGIYVYAFPTQQAIASIVGPMSPWLLFALAYPPIVALASASWSLVEKPCLAWRRGPALRATMDDVPGPRLSRHEFLRRAFRLQRGPAGSP